MTGQRFGRLVVLEPAPDTGDGNLRYRCACDCGNTTDVAAENLRRGMTRSCWCLHNELAAARMRAINQRRRFARPDVPAVSGTIRERLLRALSQGALGATDLFTLGGVSWDRHERNLAAHALARCVDAGLAEFYGEPREYHITPDGRIWLARKRRRAYRRRAA